MILKLTRPLVFLDFETTGLDIEKDRIVELAFVRLLPDGSRETLVQRVNPGVELSKGATKVTGIHTMDATGLFWGPPLKKCGDKLLEFLSDSDIAGFNQVGYDMPLWEAECKRHGIPYDGGGRHQVDAKTIFDVKETGWDRFLMGPRNLTAAVRHYCGRELEGAHGAEADTQATVDVLLAQLQRYPDLPRDVPGLAKWCGQQQAELERQKEASQQGGGF
ncbi:MAG: 3'-5' exonuclease [bacterium]|nr:3'-5' exonuclease [bacterium]